MRENLCTFAVRTKSFSYRTVDEPKQ